MKTLNLKISGMSCQGCVRSVTGALGNLSGLTVEEVAVGTARLRFDPAQLSEAEIIRALDDAGFEAEFVS